MKSRLAFLLAASIFLGSTLLFNCSRDRKGENPFVEKMDPRTKTRYKQYMIIGKRLYLQHCANCHGENGEGLAQLIPPLAKSDYLMSDVERAVCQIKNGIKGEIVVNGVSYNQEMAGHPELRSLNIGEIVTFITNSWGNVYGLTSAKEVEAILYKCAEQ